MSKRYLFPVLLWALVCVVGYVVYVGGRGGSPAPEVVDVSLVKEGHISSTDDGRAISTIPWGHLPGVDRFVLTDHDGNEVDSAKLHGTPYVVSFFFSSCPTFCRDLNEQLRKSNNAVADADIRFFTITVDPDVDTVPVLKKYADSFDAKAERWSFLTGAKKDLVAIGQGSFNEVVDRATHTDSILLVDKWGRYRDRFKWSSPEDMKRFVKVVNDVATETEPPLGVAVQTRNVMAGVDPPNLSSFAWLRDFHLEGPIAGQKIFSRQFSGEVWLAQFAGSESLEAAPKLLQAIKNHSKPIPLLTVSESEHDSAGTLSGWASPAKLNRISAEYFGVPYDRESLAKIVFVIDRWGSVRDTLDLDADDFAETLTAKVDAYRAEQKPTPPTNGTWPR